MSIEERKHRRREIDRPSALQQRIAAGGGLADWVIQGVDLSRVDDSLIDGLEQASLDRSIWLGCRFADDAQRALLRQRGAIIFPSFDELPYDPHRSQLYTVSELMQGYDSGGYTATRDFAIYAHAHRERHHPAGISIMEALAERLHDHAIDDALAEYLAADAARGVVGVMGGHGTPRSDPYYRAVARAASRLTSLGYLIVTGGGPGVMEAANLGAWLTGKAGNNNGTEPGREAPIDEAIDILRQADTISGGQVEGTPAYLEAIRAYIGKARQVFERFDDPTRSPSPSVAVPTWFYGHEPSNLFATAVAKYFDNSIREEGLLAIATAGVIYAPGSAGTMQEIFQDLTQNHYGTYGWRSPMVLLGVQRYRSVHALIKDFARQRRADALYGDMLLLTDDAGEAVDFIADHPPRPVDRAAPLYDLVRSV